MRLTEARRRPGTPSPFESGVYAAGARSRNGRLLFLKCMREYVQRPRRSGTRGDGASALLERIRAERAAGGAKRSDKTGRKPGKKA